jgi:hypothetical protein
MSEENDRLRRDFNTVIRYTSNAEAGNEKLSESFFMPPCPEAEILKRHYNLAATNSGYARAYEVLKETDKKLHTWTKEILDKFYPERGGIFLEGPTIQQQLKFLALVTWVNVRHLPTAIRNRQSSEKLFSLYQQTVPKARFPENPGCL